MKYDPITLWREAQAAIEQNERRLSVYDRLVDRYATPFFDGYFDSDETDQSNPYDYDPENFAYELVSYGVPQLVGGDPTFIVRSRSLDQESPAHREARGLRYAVNQWVLDTDFRTVMDKLALDLYFAFAVAKVTPTRTSLTYQQSQIPAEWPEVQRISPRNFLRDPLATEFERCRFLGDRTVMQLDELQDIVRGDSEASEEDREGWNKEAVERLAGLSMSEDWRRPGAEGNGADREEVELIELWFPGYNLDPDEYTEDDGFHGTIFTLAVVRGHEDAGKPSSGGGQPKDTVEFVREPRPFFGPRQGPYVHMGAARVPDDPWPLSPLVANEGPARELNNFLRTQSDDLRTWKRQVFVDADSPTVAQSIKAGAHDTVVAVNGLAGRPIRDLIQVVEVGGPSEALAFAVAEAHSRLRRVAGLGEAQTGEAPGSGTTATAVAVAAQDANTRLERLKEISRRCWEDIARAVVFYIATSADVTIVLDETAREELAGEFDAYKGGELEPKDVAQLHLEIDVISVERTSEQMVQARLMQGTALVMQSIPAALQLPYQPFWSALFEMVGDALNVPGMGRLADHMVQGALAVLMQQQEQLAQQSKPQAPSVVLGGQTPRPPAAPKPAGGGLADLLPQTGNATPGLQGVAQPTPLAGTKKPGGA